MGLIKTDSEIEIMRNTGKILAKIMKETIPFVKEGISTYEIDQILQEKIFNSGSTAPTVGFHDYPAVSCISINDQVTHGIPDKEAILKNGDIVDIDVVIKNNGYCADMSVSVGIGELAENAKNLLKFTQNILNKAIKAVVPGVRLGDIGYLIESETKKRGYSVVLDYVGHFIGEEMHEDPNVLNSGNMGEGLILKPGMTFCIEPMINEGSYKVITRGWDVRTKDGKLSCRCEHTVLVTDTGVEILTDMKNV